MKTILEQHGVIMYEHSLVTKIDNHTVYTPDGSVTAKHIIICADRFIPALQKLVDKIYQVQTFLLISTPLGKTNIEKIFPEKQYMVWDSDLVYTYYRLTGDSRLLLGGGNLLQSYHFQSVHRYELLIRKMKNYLKKTFHLTLEFQNMWGGLIGISKDIAPIAGKDRENDAIYYVGACAGLPIAAALGMYSTESILDKRDDLDSYFSPYRSVPIGTLPGKILGKANSFALSNLITKIKYQ